MARAMGIPRLGLNKTGWIILAVILWLVFVISKTPAVWGAYAMTRGGQIALSGVSGTLWSGRASLASFKVDQVDYSLGQVSWTLNPWSLLTLSPCADIKTELDRQEIEGEVCAGLGGTLKLYNTTISAPASLLQPRLPLPIEGQFSARIEELQVQGDYLRKLQGNLSWTGARIHNGNNWMSLGSYAAELRDDSEGGIIAQVFHLDGPVDIDLQVKLAAGGGGFARGHFLLTQSFAAEVQADAWLSMFAQRETTDADGKSRYRVEMDF